MTLVVILPLALLFLLAFLAMPWTAALLLRRLESDPPLTALADLGDCQAIVVLGSDYVGFAPELGGDTVGPMTLQRLHYGARLHRQSGLPLLVTGGTLGRGGRALATCMAEVLHRDFGFAVQWVEQHARSTRENVMLSSALLRAAGVHRICLVTHSFHMARARQAFVDAGLLVTAAPTMCCHVPTPLWRDFKPNGYSLSLSLTALREWFSRARDRSRGLLRKAAPLDAS